MNGISGRPWLDRPVLALMADLSDDVLLAVPGAGQSPR